ncbi:MAG: DUF1501 domain-containing protein, partial [Pirellulaceae bacterium]
MTCKLTAELATRHAQLQTRRHFLRTCQVGLGGIALSQLMGHAGLQAASRTGLAGPGPESRAKHIIYLHMAGSPPQHETFDYKPELARRHMELCPDEL